MVKAPLAGCAVTLEEVVFQQQLLPHWCDLCPLLRPCNMLYFCMIVPHLSQFVIDLLQVLKPCNITRFCVNIHALLHAFQYRLDILHIMMTY